MTDLNKGSPFWAIFKANGEEKENLRKTALIIGLAALFLMLVTRNWAKAVFFVAGIFGVDNDRLTDILRGSGVRQLLQIVLSSISFGVPSLVIFKALKLRVDDLIPFGKPKEKTTLPLLLAGFGVCAFSNASVAIAGGIFESFGVSYNVDSGSLPTGIFGFLLCFIATAVFPAIIEEFFCRGLVFGLLCKYGESFAVFTTAILFGLMHGNFEQIPFAFMVGVVLGIMRSRTGSMWPCILLHFLNNAIATIFDYFPAFLMRGLTDSAYMFYTAVSFILGIVGMFWYFSAGGDFRLSKGELELSEGKKYLWFFTSPLIIVFIIAALGVSVAYFY